MEVKKEAGCHDMRCDGSQCASGVYPYYPQTDPFHTSSRGISRSWKNARAVESEGRITEGGVRVWRESISLPTYEPSAPDQNPMFLEKRVYQGSSGKVYPLPFIDRVADHRTDRLWKAVWLENEYLRVLVLPEIGGRVHRAQDKTNGYDLIYHQHVIKPALVGLAGPWISGGIEFNWPQH
jgi:hypothetical protein